MRSIMRYIPAVSVRVAMMIALLFVLSARAEAQLTVSSDIWVDQEVDESGSFQVYGRGVASGQGMVRATAWLRAPSGTGLDYREAWQMSTAQADVSYTLNVSTMETGDYDTLATGQDDFGNMGCQPSAKYGMQPYLTRWQRGSFNSYLNCPNQYPYYRFCDHGCAGDAVLCYDTDQGGWVQGMGLRFTLAGGSWCSPSRKQGASSGACAM